MRRYQLRFPRERRLQELVDEVAEAIWEKGAEDFKLQELAPNAFGPLRDLVQGVLKNHVTQYDLCGLGVECQEGAVPGPWITLEELAVSKEQKDWYILEVREGLQELVQEITDSVILLLKEQGIGMMISTPWGIGASVEEALRDSLGRYLYENVSCGETLLCRDAQKLDPWAEARV